MAKTKAATPAEVTIAYDLFELPTAFHKAGLAGLLLLFNDLRERGTEEGIALARSARCEVTATGATITFTPSLLHLLMDDLYDAKTVEAVVKGKWNEAKTVREPTPVEYEAGFRFVYHAIQPKGEFLRINYPPGDEPGLWHKLWREMLWAIPRGRPLTRLPYNQRATGETCKEGPDAWADLLKVQKARDKGQTYTAEVSGALLLGAQAVNAEGVPFEGRAEHNILLHFWPLTVLLYVPQAVDRDGSTEFPTGSYTVAVPEVANLKKFVKGFPDVLGGLSSDPRGYRPAGAVVDLPAEGALAFMDHFARLTQADIEAGEVTGVIGSVEFMHLYKQGNNVKTMAAGRVVPSEKLLGDYRELVPVGKPPPYRNPLFRRGLLVGLLDGREWFQPFDRTLAAFDAGVFIRQPRKAGSEEKGPPQFANDAARKLRQLAATHSADHRRYLDVPEPDRSKQPRPDAPLAVVVNRVVRNYLLARTEEKTGIKVDAYTKPGDDGEPVIDWKAVPGDFNDGKRKLAESLFLEFRPRKGQAFIDHFAATLFRVTQRVNEADRLELARALTVGGRLDDLKTLTLLSLSANS